MGLPVGSGNHRPEQLAVYVVHRDCRWTADQYDQSMPYAHSSCPDPLARVN